MSNDSGTITLPLLTLGLPGNVAGWLLDAGVPLAPLDTAAVRRGIAPAESSRSIVLFDSRSASARTDAEAAEALGYETIDAARLLTGRLPQEGLDQTVIPSTDPRRRFFEGLRPAIESAGGLWIRIGDFPHPYRWAVCSDEGSVEASDSPFDPVFVPAVAAFAELPAATGPSGRLPAADWLRTCASVGRPVRTAGDAAAVLAKLGFGPGRAPLTWTCSLARFDEWWRFRRQIAIRAVRHSRACEIHVTMPAHRTTSAMPSLEIWRGRHLAVVPLKPGLNLLEDEAVPFQLCVSRHFAGFTADAPEPEFAESADRSAFVAPACK